LIGVAAFPLQTDIGGPQGDYQQSVIPRVRKGTFMKRISESILVIVVVVVGSIIASRPFAAAGAESEGSPIYGVKIPTGYRQWEVIAPSQEAGSLDELRIILGNDISMKAYREGTLPFPDGAMLAKLAWKRVPSVGDDGALGSPQAFVPGVATTVQIMVKDSKKYAATGGWGFGRFINGEPVDEAQHETCFPCHEVSSKAHDLLFTKYAH
jgi:Cytochrome P460